MPQILSSESVRARKSHSQKLCHAPLIMNNIIIIFAANLNQVASHWKAATIQC